MHGQNNLNEILCPLICGKKEKDRWSEIRKSRVKFGLSDTSSSMHGIHFDPPAGHLICIGLQRVWSKFVPRVGDSCAMHDVVQEFYLEKLCVH